MHRKAAPIIVAFVLATAACSDRGGREPSGTLALAGTIESRSARVGSLVGGRVETVHVREGQTVAAGDPIVTLETDLLDLQTAEQQAVVAAAESRLALLHEGPRDEEIARARVDWKLAETERRRLATLRAEGIVDQARLDAAKARADSAREQLQQLERGSRPEEIAGGAAALDRERQRLAFLQRQREESVVRAPAASTVQVLDLRPGDIVAPNAPVADLIEDGQLWIRVYVPEPDLGLVRVGQRAAISVDTWKGREFEGMVASIREQAEYLPRNVQTLDQRSDQVFAVRIDLLPTKDLKPGMAAIARIVLDPKK